MDRSPGGPRGPVTTLTLPVLPLTDAVVLPGMVIPVELDGEARAAVDSAKAKATNDDDAQLLIVPRIEGKYHEVGVLATIDQVGRLPNGRPAAVLRAVSRAKVGQGVNGPGAALWVEATTLPDRISATDQEKVDKLAAEYREVVQEILGHREENDGGWQVVEMIRRITEPGELADIAGWAPYLETEQKLRLLETAEVAVRLELVLEWGKQQLAELQVAATIRDDVRESMEKTQREFLLRQQLAAIRKELGEISGDDDNPEADPRARVEAADLPEKVRTAALREVDKLERTGDQSPEASWIRTWLDTVLELPWNVRTDDRTDVGDARTVLDADHAGLDDVKDRIVEYLAVRNRRAARGLEIVGGRGSGAVLALVGPPGVGKTSLGESVARALGRKFVRVALGGVRDEAEIRGHRRTYVGAQAGRIVRAIKEAGAMNPVVLLDEVDKIGADYRGDPAAALLEVLDPAQNHTFRDHYLEVELDLSDVLFLATANVAEAIPEALIDRMEVVRLDGYTELEKVAIARDHLWRRQLERAGLESTDVTIDEDALRLIAGEYTHEAGVRQLERSLARVLRKVATKLAGENPPETPIDVTVETLKDYLGRPRFTPESAERTAVPGVATGLAVTGAGGDVLFIEANAAPGAQGNGEPELVLTGQLGDVMKESAHIALSYLRSQGDRFGADPEELRGRRLHVHVPAGAVPKDGPSAGVTMVTALASLLTGRLVRAEVGMTGEVSLTGRVLPIGGVKQKLLAAHRAGLTEVLLPARNAADLDDVPASVREALTVHLMEDVADVVALALEPATTAQVQHAA
ncbi:endopeptidase La [Cryptosporangium aurantiacum]|uniref:Lon protease n=1 Tax=Cryptosporangium aurantiacum TaxID=134849 RepID=A0A1M7I0B0_9ACTN|nr:endopeptidase La [Cryptosporangium aurantiacum]SHM34150.1 ATP-dependent Lon protease [Cryptosporangium aurantiacum]